MKKILIIWLAFLIPAILKADICCDHISVSHEIITEDCCVEINVYNPLCNPETYASFYQDDGNGYIPLDEISLPKGDTTSYTICPAGSDDFVEYRVLITDGRGNPKCGNDWLEGKTQFTGTVDLSSCCDCPEDRDSWLNTYLESSPSCPDSCLFQMELDLPDTAACYRYAFVELPQFGYTSNALDLDDPDILKNYSDCLEHGETRIVNVYLTQEENPSEWCMLTDTVTCDTTDDGCDCADSKPCTPDCEDDEWEDTKTLAFESDLCPGCSVKVFYTYRTACPQEYQDLQITRMDLSTPGCNNCIVADLYGEAARRVIRENEMGFAPMANPEEDSCSTIWRIGQGGCWAKFERITSTGNDPWDPIEIVTSWENCEIDSCCFQGFKVCTSDQDTIYITAQTEPTIYNCEGTVYHPDFPETCEPKCNWLQSVEGYIGPLGGGEGTHGKYGIEFPDMNENNSIGVRVAQENETLYFELRPGDGMNCDISLYDINGNLLDSRSFNMGTGRHYESFNLDSYNTGVFLYSLTVDGKTLKTGKASIVK